MIPAIIYLLCGLTSGLSAVLLFRHYRVTRTSLLFWSTCCFFCLMVTNILLFIDLVILPDIDLSILRGVVTLSGMVLLLYGLIRERT